MMIAHPSPPEPGRAPVYPWAEWLDGRTWTLVRGRDFWDDLGGFRRRAQSSANARRLTLDVQVSGSAFMTIRAVPRG